MDGASSVASARQATYLFGVGAARALLALVIRPGHHAVAYALLLAANLLLTAISLGAPWRRWPSWSTAVLALPGFAVVGAAQALGLAPGRATGIPYVIVFAWLGAHHRRRVCWIMLVPAAVSCGLPVTQGGHTDPRALVVTLAGCLLVATVIATSMQASRLARARALSAAEAFRVVAHASADLHRLDTSAVLERVVDAVIELGYDGASLALIDGEDGTSQVRQIRGLQPSAGATEGGDITREVLRSGMPAVASDSAAGLVLAAPVSCRGRIVAVLFALSQEGRTVQPEEIEAIKMLAATAGTALDTAQQFARQRETARDNAVAALTDQLTGVGNRRRAQQLLETLAPGDTLIMIDLDHFKEINDRLGHAAGDALLQALAAHLVNGVREGDQVLRYGGEEFLIVLPGLGLAPAERLVQRLLVSWRESRPAATFSIGLAQHIAPDPRVTLEQADQAMYAAKAAGRDTYRAFTKSRLRAVPHQPVDREGTSPLQALPRAGG